MGYIGETENSIVISGTSYNLPIDMDSTITHIDGNDKNKYYFIKYIDLHVVIATYTFTTTNMGVLDMESDFSDSIGSLQDSTSCILDSKNRLYDDSNEDIVLQVIDLGSENYEIKHNYTAILNSLGEFIGYYDLEQLSRFKIYSINLGSSDGVVDIPLNSETIVTKIYTTNKAVFMKYILQENAFHQTHSYYELVVFKMNFNHPNFMIYFTDISLIEPIYNTINSCDTLDIEINTKTSWNHYIQTAPYEYSITYKEKKFLGLGLGLGLGLLACTVGFGAILKLSCDGICDGDGDGDGTSPPTNKNSTKSTLCGLCT
jgi:hypothetical protein